MDIQPELVCALRMTALHVKLRATFELASNRDALLNQVQVCQIADDFVRNAEETTGLKASHVEMFPGERTFSVEGSPLLIRTLVDHGPGVVRKVMLG